MKMISFIESYLKTIKLDDGDVLHALKKTDIGFEEFGEFYFSKIKYKKIKAWKMHTKITLNLVVPFGNVEFAIRNDEGDFQTITIGENNYKRLTIPPGIWHGFKGLNKEFSLIASVIDKPHDPSEIMRKELGYFNYEWKN